MNETFWGLYDAQIKALKECTSPEEANTIMLETAKFLVEHVDLSEGTMEQYDKFGIRKLFAAHNALGGAVTAFYDAKKDQLDPAAQNGAIGQKISSISEQIASTADALEKLQELEKDLFSKEGELVALEKELEAMKEKAAHLHDTEANAAAETQRYKEQFEQLDAIITGHADEIAFWEAHLGEDSSIIRAMSVYGVTSIQELLTSIEKLKENVRFSLSALDAVIKKVVVAEDAIKSSVLKKQNRIV